MTDDGRRPAKQSREQLLQQIAQLSVERVPELPGADRVLEFVRHYFKHAENSILLTRPAQQIVRSLLYHVQLAHRRSPGESHIDLHTPSLEQDGWEAGGHTVLTLVADDKAWLVDTISLAVNAQAHAADQSADSLRVYSQAEIDRLGEDSIGFISFLESAGVLPPAMREMVIDRASAAADSPLALEDLKVIVLMVFWSLGEEPDALILDELFVAPEERLIH